MPGSLIPIPALLRRKLPILVWGYLATSVAAVAFMWVFGDAWWPANILLFGPRWLLLLPVFPLAAGALLVRPRLLPPLTLGLIITLGPMMGFRTGWRRWIYSGSSGALRIITFNVASSQNTRSIDAPALLVAYNPDIMVFQECQPDLTRPQLWPPGWTAHFVERGICLGTRFPVVESRELERVETGDQGGTGNAVLFRLLTGGDTLAVAGIHLETPRKGLESLRYAGNASRMPVNILIREVGARRVSRWIRKEAGNPIIAGDFNMPVESRIYREYFGDCTNAFSTIGTGFGYTRVLRRFSARIDHIVTCGGWRPIHIEIGPDIGSDHRPVIVDLARTR